MITLVYEGMYKLWFQNAILVHGSSPQDTNPTENSNQFQYQNDHGNQYPSTILSNYHCRWNL